jgi:hypothetical protein
MVEKMMQPRFTHWAAGGIVALFVLGLVGIIILQFNGCPIYGNPVDSSPATTFGNLITFFQNSAFALLGLLIIKFRPQNRIGWLALLFATVSMWNSFGIALNNCTALSNIASQNGMTVTWLLQISSLLVLVTLGLFLMTFPDGHFLSHRWRRLSMLLIVLMSLYMIYALINGAMPATELAAEDELTSLLLPLFIFPLLGILSLFLRWRRAAGDERQQIKWVAFFLMTAGTLFFAVEVVGTLFYPSIFDGWFYLFDVTLFLVGFPVVFGLAIFKYRLYDIDIIIRRTLVYALVTLGLALVYFGSVVILQRLFTGATGQESPLAIVLSTLLIAALFNPLRRRVQKAIDRRFYRRKYDAQQVLARFAGKARDETDRERLVGELGKVIQETLQPENVSVWMKR